MSRHDDIAAINSFANELEIIANKLSGLMPTMRAARQALSGITPRAGWDSEYGGSADPHAAATPEALSFARIERARQRVLKILREPWDDQGGSPTECGDA